MKKKIVIVTPEFITEDYFDGGLASFLEKFVNFLSKFYEVTVIVSSEFNEKRKYKNFTLHRVKVKNIYLKIIKFFNFGLLNLIIYYPLQSFLLNKYLNKLNKLERYNFFFYTNFEYVSLFQSRKIKSIIRISSLDYLWFRYNLINKFISKFYDYLVFRNCSQIWSTSKYIKKYIDKKFVYKTYVTKPFINYKPIPNDKLIKKLKLEKKRFILFVGTISSRKGIKLIRTVFKNLLIRYPDLILVIIGRDTTEYFFSNYKIYFADFLKKNLIYLSVQDRKTIFSFIQKSKFVLIPSIIETSPNILQEVIINNAIPVCSNNTSMEELVCYDKNFLFTNGNANSLYNKCVYYLTSDKIRYNLIKNRIIKYKKILLQKKNIIFLKKILEFTDNNHN